MFRRIIILVVALVTLCMCSTSSAESWKCPNCDNEANGNFCNICGSPTTSEYWTCIQCKTENKGNFCSNCGTAKPSLSSTIATPEATPDPNLKTQQSTVKNYVGRTISLCGYTSMGGERRDKYGSTNLELIMVCPDGTYIDPNDESVLDSYTVVAQIPAANTSFCITSNLDGSLVNLGVGEIILIVKKNGEADPEIPIIAELNQSPGKETHYVRDYTGRVLADAGYTSMGGKRYDKYGPSGLIQLILIDENGTKLDPSDYKDFKYYTVLSQSVEPNTEITFYYDGENVTGQSIDLIQLTVAISPAGKATMEALAAEEAQQRADGLLVDLYSGTYEVGVDIQPGNYVITHISDSCSLYTYTDRTALDNDSGEWDYLYGEGDKSYQYLTQGMFLKVSSGAVKALRSDFSTDGNEFPLFSGVYRVGVELTAGSYEFSLISDSCSIYVYADEEAYVNEDGDWGYLYGSGDTEHYALTDGMVLKVSSGATLVTKK